MTALYILVAFVAGFFVGGVCVGALLGAAIKAREEGEA